MTGFGAVLDQQVDRYQSDPWSFEGNLSNSKRKPNDSSKKYAPVFCASAAAPYPESLPEVLINQLAPRGDPYAKVKVLFEYASDRINALQKKTDPGGESFFAASNDSLLATLRWGPAHATLRGGVGMLDRFKEMPEPVQAVVKSGQYDAKFCQKWDGHRFVVHAEEVLPCHEYQFVVVIADGAVRLGWRWAFIGAPPQPFGPRWLYGALCQVGENPQEKLNALVAKIRNWSESLRAQQHDLLDGFGSELRSLPSALQDIFATWGTANDDSRTTEDLTPYAGKPHFVHRAQLDDEHWRCLHVEIRLATSREAASLDLRWSWLE